MNIYLIYILTKKNLKLFITKKSNIFLLISLPILIKLTIVYFSLTILQAKKSSYLPNPSSKKIQKIPKCTTPKNCTSLGYFILGPEKSWIHKIMKTLSKKNNLIFKKDTKNLLNTKNQSEILNYTNMHKNQTQIAIIFCTSQWEINFNKYNLKIPCNFEKLDDKLIYYSIYYNMTLGFESPYFFKSNSTFPINEIVLSTKRALDEAILSVEGNSDFEFLASRKSFPVIENLFYKNTDFMSSNGCFLFYVSVGFSFLLVVGEIVREKVRGLKLFMRVSGMGVFSFLGVWSVWSVFLGIVFAILNCFVVLMCDEDIVKNVFLGFWFFYFFFCVFVMNVFAILIGSVASSGKSGYMYAYSFLLFSFVFQALLNNPNSMNIFYSGKFLATVFKVIFEFYPGFNFIKIYSDLVFFSGAYFKIDQKMFVRGRKLKFEDIFTEYTKNTLSGDIVFPSIFNSFLKLFRNLIVFYVLIYIFEKTLKSNQGVSFDLKSIFCKNKKERENLKEILKEDNTKKHSSVIKEEKKVDKILNNRFTNKNFKNSIIINKISKTYKTGNYFFPKKSSALKNIKFLAKRGEILSILGQNGAGKTTLINILTGYLSSTSGKAHILGLPLSKNLSKIRKKISLCPQNDIFWPELTITEHLKIFSKIKNLSTSSLKQETSRLLQLVSLTSKKDTKIKHLSGGMKRRLSIAISSIADPEIILYDEPTNGLDPIRRKMVLELLRKLKKDKVLILTTHSMEEADELSDKIVVLREGRVCCVGDSDFLKGEFRGEILFFWEGRKWRDFVRELGERFGDVEVLRIVGERVFMKCSRELFAYVVGVFKFFLDEGNGFCDGVIDWGFSEINLEQVFFNLHKKMDK